MKNLILTACLIVSVAALTGCTHPDSYRSYRCERAVVLAIPTPAQPAPTVMIPAAPPAGPRKYTRTIKYNHDEIAAGANGANVDSSMVGGETIEIVLEDDGRAPFDPLQADPLLREISNGGSQSPAEANLQAEIKRLKAQQQPSSRMNKDYGRKFTAR